MTNHRGFGWGAAIRTFLLLAGVVVLWLVIWPEKAKAQTQCGDYDRIVSVLVGKFGEAVKVNGTSGNRIMEAFVSLAGNWTILITRADGFSCIVAAGQNWEDVLFEPGRKS